MALRSSKGWCDNCAESKDLDADLDAADVDCEVCGVRLKAMSRVTESDRAAGRFMDWMRSVSAGGMWGVSPGGAAAELKCGRATIDDLVRLGVLERSEYDADGHYVILISSRSIERAKENKRVTGRWSGFPGAKHEYGS